ncbi:MAG: winged helix-turn-helix transcriptional regulator [Elusimicrobiota bacterium]|nr:winged helix-turn-helix transcriptional regulator [Elusimicrobiota bacterium]
MEKIIDVMRINPYISIQELASKMRLSEKGVEWQIKSLKKNGVLKRIGPDKGGVWKLLEK